LLLSLLLPLFLLAGGGWALARSGWLATGWAAGAAELTVKLLLPALLLNGAYKSALPATLPWQPLAAFYIPLVALFLLLAFTGRDQPRSAARALAATYSNNAFVGIPVLVQVFGEGSLRHAFPVIAFHSLAGFSLYYIMARRGREGASMLRSLRAAAMNPIVASLFIGFALNLAGIALPQALARILDMLSGAALPCALLVLGASLAGLRSQRMAETVAIGTAKLAVLPLMVLLMAHYVFALPPDSVAVLVVMSACPVGVNAALVVRAEGQDPAAASSSILLSSIACMATLPAWLWLLQRL
jgi:malonate transporter